METNRLDTLLTNIIENKQIEDWKCLNRLEQYLVWILTRQEDQKPTGEPLNRLEVLLSALYEVVPENSMEIISARLEAIENKK